MPIESCLMNHSSNIRKKKIKNERAHYHSCLLFYIPEQMSTTNALLLIDDERKAQLDLLNKIDASGTNLSCSITHLY